MKNASERNPSRDWSRKTIHGIHCILGRVQARARARGCPEAFFIPHKLLTLMAPMTFFHAEVLQMGRCWSQGITENHVKCTSPVHPDPFTRNSPFGTRPSHFLMILPKLRLWEFLRHQFLVYTYIYIYIYIYIAIYIYILSSAGKLCESFSGVSPHPVETL